MNATPPHAALALELPCLSPVGPELTALVYYGGQLLHICTPCRGRLTAPRHLGRELDALLRAYLRRATAQALELRASSAFQGRLFLAAAQGWAKRVRRAHLTAHHLRVPRTDSLHCFQLPTAVYRHLLHQLHQPLHQRPVAERLSLRFCAPVTPTMRLLDCVAVYLRPAPTQRRAHGPWNLCWHERCHARLGLGKVLVVLE
ncbi:MAG: hypothetical protein IPM46_02785 [Flavobacteriales bacterium]|nr:hypothetical protein [Flavobacteriales bacterium]